MHNGHKLGFSLGNSQLHCHEQSRIRLFAYRHAVALEQSRMAALSLDVTQESRCNVLPADAAATQGFLVGFTIFMAINELVDVVELVLS